MMDALPESLSILDGLSLLLLLGLGILGAFKGAVRFVIGLVAVTAGMSLAAAYGGSLNAHTWPMVADTDDPVATGTLVGGAVIFVACLLLGALVAKLMRAALEHVALGGIDRFVGFLIGAAKATLFIVVGVFVLMLVDVPSITTELRSSRTFRYTQELAKAVRGQLPESTRDLVDDVLELREEPELQR